MLIQCEILEWPGFPNRTGEAILNTRRMSRAIDRSGGSCRLYYSSPDGHRKGNLHPITIDKTAAQVNTASETTPYDDFLSFDVYLRDNLNSTPVEMSFRVRDIVRIAPYDATHSVLFIHHNEVDIDRYIVRYGLDSIINLVIGGSTTTGEDFDWSTYCTLTSGLIVYRKGERDGMYVIDKSIDGGTTWELAIVQLEPDEDSIIISIDDGVDGYRHVIRDEAYCIDYELTPTGFDGVENTDWENIYNTNTI